MVNFREIQHILHIFLGKQVCLYFELEFASIFRWGILNSIKQNIDLTEEMDILSHTLILTMDDPLFDHLINSLIRGFCKSVL